MKRAARLTAILDLLAEQGEVSVEELVERFGASAATTRRDLDSLAERRLLTRTHGGAVAQSLAYELPIRYRSSHGTGAKEQIAAAAAALVAPGQVVGLSGGTTTNAIATALAARDDLAEGLTVVTNAVNIASQLAMRPEFKVVVTGGVIHPRSFELVGPFVEQLLGGIRLDIAFIGVNGLSAESGASTHDEAEAAVNRLMAQRAGQAYIVADSSKIGHDAFAHVGGAELFPVVLTDAALDAAAHQSLVDVGYEVRIP